MNVVFCGTPHFAVPTLDKLLEYGHKVSLVVTRPDRPQGRGMAVAHSPVKQHALERQLAIAQPEKIKDNSVFRAQLSAAQAAAFIVVGYGRIIPAWMRELPPLGNINLHASLLPKYRGAAPIQWAIARGERVTGVTTMLIDEGLDTGDILLQQELPIEETDTAVTLSPKLATIGADLMIRTLDKLEKGEIEPRPEDHHAASLAPILKREDGRIDFALTAREIVNRLRAFQPWPGGYTPFRGKTLQVLKAQPSSLLAKSHSGEMIVENERLHVACASGTLLELLELQLEGKNPVSASDFIRGYRLQGGEKLGD